MKYYTCWLCKTGSQSHHTAFRNTKPCVFSFNTSLVCLTQSITSPHFSRPLYLSFYLITADLGNIAVPYPTWTNLHFHATAEFSPSFLFVYNTARQKSLPKQAPVLWSAYLPSIFINPTSLFVFTPPVLLCKLQAQFPGNVTILHYSFFTSSTRMLKLVLHQTTLAWHSLFFFSIFVRSIDELDLRLKNNFKLKNVW